MVLPLELVLQTGIKSGKTEEGVNPSPWLWGAGATAKRRSCPTVEWLDKKQHLLCLWQVLAQL